MKRTPIVMKVLWKEEVNTNWRHVPNDESADEENVVPHNVSEVQQLRYVEFQGKNFDDSEPE